MLRFGPDGPPRTTFIPEKKDLENILIYEPNLCVIHPKLSYGCVNPLTRSYESVNDVPYNTLLIFMYAVYRYELKTSRHLVDVRGYWEE